MIRFHARWYDWLPRRLHLIEFKLMDHVFNMLTSGTEHQAIKAATIVNSID